MAGDFTNRFDREILRSKMADMDALKAEQAKEQQELDKIERDLMEIGKIIERRASFLSDRFSAAKREEIGGIGFKFTFAPGEGKTKESVFSLRARPNDSRLAIIVESNFDVPDANAKEYDYIAISIAKMDIDRAKAFIEAKLLDFARVYVG